MLGGVQVQLDCPDQAAATHVSSGIDNYVGSLPVATTWKFQPTFQLRKGTGYRVIAALWYTDPTQAENVFNQIQTIWSSGQYKNDVLSGSYVHWHECREDEYNPNDPSTFNYLDCSPSALDARGQRHGEAFKP